MVKQKKGTYWGSMTKSQAKFMAQDLREKGWNARVIKDVGNYWGVVEKGKKRK